MKIEFDPEKSARNVALRHLSFDLVQHFDWENAAFSEDARVRLSGNTVHGARIRRHTIVRRLFHANLRRNQSHQLQKGK